METHPLPARFTPHLVSVRALTGSGGMGTTYADPATEPAFVVDGALVVRDASGAEVVSSTQVTLGFNVVAPPGSLVTVWPSDTFFDEFTDVFTGGREATVITSSRAAHPRLPAYQTLALT